MSGPHQEIVDAWERQGAGAALPPELEKHLGGCAACAARVEEILSMRALVARLSAPPLPEDSVARMRAQLIDRAHESRWDRDTGPDEGDGADEERRSTAAQPWKWAGVAAAALLLVGFGFALRWWTAPAAPAAPASSVAGGSQPERAGFWIGEDDAQVEQVSAGPREVVWLRHGAVWFKVNPLPAGNAFRVIAGNSEIEVVGTRFRVDVEHGRLRSVQVAEGRVLVRTRGQLAADLNAGERWASPEFAQAEAVQKTPDVADAPTPDDAPDPRGQAASVRDAPEPRQAAPGRDDALAAAELLPPAPRVEAPEKRKARPARVSARKSGIRASAEGAAGKGAVHETPKRVARPSAAPDDSADKDGALERPTQPSAASPQPTAKEAPSVDERFAQAWELYQAGRFPAAARSLDRISKLPQQDNARRAEILYWSARAHLQSGAQEQAARQLRRSLQLSPQGWWADDARQLLRAMTPAGE